MDLSDLDFAPGRDFAAAVHAALGVPVTTDSPIDASTFWLIPSFSRSRLQLTVENVGFILQSVLHLELRNLQINLQWLRWRIGFTSLLLHLELLVCGFTIPPLKASPNLSFVVNLWNSRGVAHARSFIATS